MHEQSLTFIADLIGKLHNIEMLTVDRCFILRLYNRTDKVEVLLSFVESFLIFATLSFF